MQSTILTVLKIIMTQNLNESIPHPHWRNQLSARSWADLGPNLESDQMRIDLIWYDLWGTRRCDASHLVGEVSPTVRHLLYPSSLHLQSCVWCIAVQYYRRMVRNEGMGSVVLNIRSGFIWSDLCLYLALLCCALLFYAQGVLCTVRAGPVDMELIT